MDSPATELAKEFFSMGNIITGFYVAQTLLFINSLTKENNELRTIFSRDHAIGPKYTWVIASVYLVAVVGCVVAEGILRNGVDQLPLVTFVAIGAGVGRLVIILAVASICQLILRDIRPPPTKNG